ncbi:hypothetical protein BH23ACT11_BH23ACT11_16550 [soil metagenome]
MTRSTSTTGEEDAQHLPGRGNKSDPTSRKRSKGSEPLKHFRSRQALVLLLAIISLVILVVLRDVLSSVPGVLYLATLTLFMVPGYTLSRLVPDERFSGMARLPLSFVLSIGIYGLPAVPFLLLNRTFDEYLLLCGVLLAVSMFMLMYWIMSTAARVRESSEDSQSLFETTLWLPFLGLAAALAYTSSRVVQPPDRDHWAYLAYVREFLSDKPLGLNNPFFGDEVGGFSRIWLDGWLMELAGISRLSGIDPVLLFSNYLAPTLVVASLLVFYGFGKMLFESDGAALLAGSLYALFLIIHLDLSPDSFGGELVQRVTEDKFAARYLLLPMALSLAVAFLRHRRWLYLAIFTFVFWSTGAVHPMLMGILGISLTGFGLVFIFVNRRHPGSWMRMGALAGVMLATITPPAVYLLAIGSPLLSKLETLDQASVAYRLRIWESQDRLLLMGDGGSYIMHPALVLNPVIAAAYLIGVPFLIWRMDRSLSAQLLLGMLLFTPLLVYIPAISTFIGQFIGPWLIYRLAWPIPLAALLTIGWMTWAALEYLGRRLGRLELTNGRYALAPLALVLLLTAVAAPHALAGIRTLDTTDEVSLNEGTCRDPAYEWIQRSVDVQTIVLAPGPESSCVPAYDSMTNVLTYRNQLLAGATDGTASRRSQDAQAFFDSNVITSADLRTLSRHSVGLILVPDASQLNVQLGYLPGFTLVDSPGDRYVVFEVDDAALDVTPALQGNDLLANGEVEAAMETYRQALSGDTSEKVLSYLGLAMAYEELSEPELAAANYEEAASLDEDWPILRTLLAESYERADEVDLSLLALRNGLERFPESVVIRNKLASYLRSQDPEMAIEVLRPVVEKYPEVPEYRIELAKFLAASGKEVAAEEQFSRASRIAPLSAALQEQVAVANRVIGRDHMAIHYYKRALSLEPKNGAHAFSLGTIYAGLAADSPQRDEYFDLAERYLERASEQKPLPGRPELRTTSSISLGDLYMERDRIKDAREAYNRALEVNPDATRAQEKLDELDGQ